MTKSNKNRKSKCTLDRERKNLMLPGGGFEGMWGFGGCYFCKCVAGKEKHNCLTRFPLNRAGASQPAAIWLTPTPALTEVSGNDKPRASSQRGYYDMPE